MQPRLFRKVLLFMGILFFSLPIMIQPAIAQEIPAGLIVMWSGSVNDIPSGWALCDGTNGTPDLTDRFIMGVSASEEPGAVGGSETHSHAIPPHAHTVDPPSVNSVNATGWNVYYVGRGDHSLYYTPVNHYHKVDIPAFQSGSVSQTTYAESNLPPYYQLAFIMKLPETHDCANLNVVASYPFPGQGAPAGLAYHKDLYVADRVVGQVVKVKVSSDSLKVLDTIDLPGDCPEAIKGLTHDGKNLWYTNGNWGGGCTPTIVNFTESGELLSSFTSPGAQSDGLAFDGQFLWNSQEMGDQIGMIHQVNTTSGDVETSFESPGNGPRDLTFHEGYLWHVDTKTDNLYKLDSSGNVLSTCNLARIGISQPLGLTSDGTYLWIAEEGTGMLHQISLGK